ncbi:CapA family protein [Ruminococcaceae bacterium OttesenSCG-928-O06]|nr:CapA family protein [Ruminococcaceae bacterium OttesenSCG-928-O06]
MKYSPNKTALLTTILSLLLLFALAACGGNPAGTSSSVPPASSLPDVSISEPPPPQPEELRVTFSAVGDNLVHNGIFLQAQRRAAEDEGYNFDFCFEQVKYFYEQFDVNWMNQETLLNDEFAPAGYPMFSTPYQMGYATYNAGWRVYALSNNHSYDLGAAGVASTRRVWADMPEDVVTTGFFTSREDDSGIAMHEVNGMTIAYLSYTDHTNGLPTPQNTEAFVIYTSEEDVIERQVRRAAELADAVVVGIHWEVENSHQVTDKQRTLAANLADWGATAIIGTHPHVIQPIEYITGTETGRSIPVAYSLGNFLSAQAQANQLVGYTFAFEMVQIAQPDGTRGEVTVENVKAYPTVTHYGSGYADIHTYMFRDYTEELATSHGVRARYPNFNMAYIQELLQTYVSDEYLVLD